MLRRLFDISVLEKISEDSVEKLIRYHVGEISSKEVLRTPPKKRLGLSSVKSLTNPLRTFVEILFLNITSLSGGRVDCKM